MCHLYRLRINTHVLTYTMLCFIARQFSDHLQSIYAMRPRFNDALNDAVAKLNARILTINSCNSYDHFNRNGKLLQKGKEEYWWELDDLLQRFDLNRIKLLPNPKNPPGKRFRDNQHQGFDDYDRKYPSLPWNQHRDRQY